MPIADGHLLEVEFDFVKHALLLRTSRGDAEQIELRARPVAEFYTEYRAALERMAVIVPMDPVPVEVADRTPFDHDLTHHSYDPDAVSRFSMCFD